MKLLPLKNNYKIASILTVLCLSFICSVQLHAQQVEIDVKNVKLQHINRDSCIYSVDSLIYVNGDIKLLKLRPSKGFKLFTKRPGNRSKFVFYNNDKEEKIKINAKGRGYRLYVSDNYCLIVTHDITRKYSHKSKLYKIDLASWELSRSTHFTEKYVGLNSENFYFLIENKKKSADRTDDYEILKVSQLEEEHLFIPFQSKTKQDKEIQLFNEDFFMYSDKTDSGTDEDHYFINLENNIKSFIGEISNLKYGLYYFFDGSMICYDENRRTFYSVNAETGITELFDLYNIPGSDNYIFYYMKDFRIIENYMIIIIHGELRKTIQTEGHIVVYDLNSKDFIKIKK